MIRGGDERDFADADLLSGHEHLADVLVPALRITANMHFRLRLLACDAAQLGLQFVLTDSSFPFQ